MARLSRLSPPAGQALPRFLALYVALQPLLDVLTSLATQAEISLTAGTVVRTLFVGFAFLYTVFCGPFPGREGLALLSGPSDRVFGRLRPLESGSGRHVRLHSQPV